MRLMYLVSTTGAHCLTCLSKNNVRNALKRGEAYLCVGKKKSHAFTFRIGKKIVGIQNGEKRRSKTIWHWNEEELSDSLYTMNLPRMFTVQNQGLRMCRKTLITWTYVGMYGKVTLFWIEMEVALQIFTLRMITSFRFVQRIFTVL